MAQDVFCAYSPPDEALIHWTNDQFINMRRTKNKNLYECMLPMNLLNNPLNPEHRGV